MATTEANRRKANCIECSNFKPIKAKNMCQNCWHKVKRKYKAEFLLSTRYSEIVQRCINVNNKCAELYNGFDYCTKSEFMSAFLYNEKFLLLFTDWQESGFLPTLAPSVDRIDVTKGYTLDNIQIITHSNNCTKDQIKQEVFVYDLQMNFVAKFESQGKASRELKIPQANIWKVINGQRKKAGGYIFIGGEYKK